MNLFETFYEDLIMMDKTTISDGMGGFSTEWVEGASFRGAVVTQATTEQRQAEQAIGAVSYQITTQPSAVLNFGDVIKRANGSYLKVTSDNSDVETPGVSSFKFRQCTAEKWNLIDG